MSRDNVPIEVVVEEWTWTVPAVRIYACPEHGTEIDYDWQFPITFRLTLN